MYYEFTAQPPKDIGYRHVTVLDQVYVRGWPVLMAAWVVSRFDYNQAFNIVRFITLAFSNWGKLRMCQKRAGIRPMDRVAFMALINKFRTRPGWRNMPKHMFFAAIRESEHTLSDPRPILREFINGRSGKRTT